MQECLVDIRRRLSASGISDSRHEAYLLLQHFTGWTLTGLLTRLQTPLPPDIQPALEEAVERRLRHEPLQHITGSTGFYGRDFTVDYRALIPRPETEILVERVTSHFAGVSRPLRFLDVGTGSGIIAITLACELSHALVDAVDISAEAIEVARANVRLHRVEGRVSLIQTDLGTPFRRAYDAIVANLPYIPSADWAHLQPEVRLREPARALDGGPDGLTHVTRLLAQAPSLLLPGGLLVVEIGEGQADRVEKRLQVSGCWNDIQVRSDLAGIRRVVTARLSRE
ncbi:MAG: peptide chain release factor N(5)-glutamine methyltransferase [Chloroflexota bacterium]